MKPRFMFLAAALAAGGAAAAATTGAAAGPQPCKTSALVVWLDTTSNAGAGGVYYTLKFTNQSGRSCALTGYPGVSALDLGGHALGSPASRNPSATRTIRLANGATASAPVRIAFAGNFPPASCHPRPAAALRVYPPNETAAKVVPLPFQACARSGPVFLSVKAVHG